MNHVVILFYKYAKVADPARLVADQQALCAKLGLKGRVLIAAEGINGTLEGAADKIEEYCQALHAVPELSDVVFKKSAGTGKTFPKLKVKLRGDIVANSINEWGVDPERQTGKRLAPDELHQWIREGRDIHIVDMRNDYEQKSGRFEGSILPGLKNFRDLPDALPALAHLKDKKVVTVCTGGVRCEKASALLLKHGFADVSQLDGGIVTYMEKYPNQDFKGKLYVFDERLVMGFETDSAAHEVVGKCDKCGATCDQYVNCSNKLCNLHFICCADCHADPEGKTKFCSERCAAVVFSL